MKCLLCGYENSDWMHETMDTVCIKCGGMLKPKQNKNLSDQYAEAAGRELSHRPHSTLETIEVISRHYETVMARLADLERWRSDLYQDQCEGAYVETSWADAALQALSEVAPDHPLLKGEPPSYGVWLSLRKENERLRAENTALRTVLRTGTCHES